jgi:hypothetical protein
MTGHYAAARAVHEAHTPRQHKPTPSPLSWRIADVAAMRDRSPFWGLTLVLGEIAERLGRRQAEELASDENAA